MSWEEPENTTSRRASRLQFEVAECVETKTVTTTTTTKRSFPPLFVRKPRQLNSLDSKEYPLASKTTPPELSKFTVDFSDIDGESLPAEDANELDVGILLSATLSRSFLTRMPQEQSLEATESTMKLDTDLDTPVRQPSVPPTLVSEPLRRSQRSAAVRAASPLHAAAKSLHKLSSRHGTLSQVSDKLRRAVTNGPRKDAERFARSVSASGCLATPDTSEIAGTGCSDRASRTRALYLDSMDTSASQPANSYEVDSPTASESHTIFSNNVATPPITDADLAQFDVDDLLHPQSFQGRPISTVAAQDASLPSPRLSPTLAAAQLDSQNAEGDADEDDDEILFSQHMTRPNRRTWIDDGSIEERYVDEDDASPVMGRPSGYFDSAMVSRSTATAKFLDPRVMLESFDALPNEMKSFMMYQFLRRCPRKTLHMVADTVNPALQCDFLQQLPVELSLHVLSYLDHQDLCRAAQVSKHWRNIVDSNETGWKELFDRDGFVLAPGELNKAIFQGWGWQDPVGAEGCEVDLSLQSRLTLPDSELTRPALKPEKAEATPKARNKRKRGTGMLGPDRSKRRASGQDGTVGASSPVCKTHKSEGPISAANAAAWAVPDPQLGLPSLRKLHLFKSLYRRHYMIRKSWTSGKVKPGHVAFAAHPRHVITCLQFDDDKIITGSDDTLIHVYDTNTGKLRTKLEGHEGGVWALQYEGNTLVSGSTDRSVRVWDIQKGICTQTFFGHTSTVRCLQILMPTNTGKLQDGQPVMMPAKPLIITGSRDSQLRVWRLPEAGSRRYIQTGPPASDDQCPYFIRILAGHTHSVRAISAHGDTLVSGSYDSTVRVWRISTGEQRHILHGHSQKVYSVVLDHARNRCISGSMDSLVKIWDLDTGACLHTLEGHSLLVGLLDLRDERLVSAAADSTLRIWDPETGRCKSTLMAHTGAITCFQHDGRKVVSGSEKTVKMWDIHTGECIQDLLTDLSGVWQVKFDERRCVAAVQRDNLTYVEVSVPWLCSICVASFVRD